MYYDEFHNHKWARNLKHARQLLAANRLHEFYHGEDLPDGDVYPGMRVMAAYWVSVEHEMKLRRKILLKGANHPEWENDPELLKQAHEFHARYISDMKELVVRDVIVPAERLDALAAVGWETPDDWAEVMRARQQASLAALEAGYPLSTELVEGWFDSCLRSVANYNRYLIWGGVNAAALVRREGPQALQKAVDAVAEEFMWSISKEFFATVLPAAGFEDIGDLMELGLRGMFADQYYVKGEDREEGEKTVRISMLKNCELAGIYNRVEEWNKLPHFSLGYGICRFDEVHGQATMMITMPPMVSPQYRLVKSLAMHPDAAACVFELTTVPADDMERILMVQEKIFGPVE
ncbi:MAG: hypothetical protein MUC85_02105 [Anaerolineales bacterium]|jgi:hypothetical protein|nr:hypothetical protein [Anaerolineales bacterium]